MDTETSIEIPQSLLDKLNKSLNDKPDLYLKFLVFLSSSQNLNYTTTLKHILNTNQELFEKTVELMANDALKAIDDDSFKKVMHDIWQSYLSPTENINNESVKMDLEILLSNKQTLQTLQFNLINALSKLDTGTAISVINQIKLIAQSFSPTLGILVKSAESNMSIIQSGYGAVVAVALASVHLAYEVYKTLYQWWNGDISKERCLTKVTNSVANIAGGIGGGVAGSMIAGALFGPLGVVAGGVIGGITVSKLSEMISDWLMRTILDIPKDEALENSFKFLGLNHRATNTEINSKFRELCLRYHPDKGGDVEKFHQLQYCMSIIKFSRGEKA